jgi:hypothetical protein
MGHSYKNTSMGNHHKEGDSGSDYISIRENHDPKPPAGESNSYEMVRKKIDHHDEKSLKNKHYTREKMMNK